MRQEQPQRTAMNRNEFDVADHQTVTPAERLDRTQGVIAKVLVIDRVELKLADEVAQVWRFDDGNAIRLEHLLDPADKCVRIGNVSEDVVRMDDVGKFATHSEASGKFLVEELDQRRNPLLNSEVRDVGRRFNAKNLNPARLVELQQISIVAGDLDHPARGAQVVTLDQRL